MPNFLDNRVTEALDRLYPYWWERAPKNALPFHYKARTDLGKLGNGAKEVLLEIKTKQGFAAVVFYGLESYTSINGVTETTQDHPGVNAGRLAWYPTADGQPALEIHSSYIQNGGYVGAPGSFGGTHTGWSEGLPMTAPRPDPIILGSDRRAGIEILILDTTCGDAIGANEHRFLSASLYGWQVPIPPISLVTSSVRSG